MLKIRPIALKLPRLAGLMMAAALIALCCLAPAQQAHAAKYTLGKVKVEQGQFWKLRIPENWVVKPAPSHCNQFSLIAFDPERPERKVFFYGAIGPVTMSYQQRNIDTRDYNKHNLMYPQLYYPVMDPFNLKMLLESWDQYAASPIAQEGYLPDTPKMSDMKVVDHRDVLTPFTEHGSLSFVARGVFKGPGEKQASQGLFTVSMMPQTAFTNKPWMHTGMIFNMVGVMSDVDEFKDLEPELSDIAASIRLESSYVEACTSQVKGTYSPMLYAGKNLSTVGKMFHNFWIQQQFKQDIMVQQGSDKIRGTGRLYDPMTFDVYIFDQEEYDAYLSNPSAYSNPGLKPISDVRHDLWVKKPKDGASLKK